MSRISPLAAMPVVMGKIPDAPARVVVSPVKGDATTRIQFAIDCAASLAPDSNGLRGAVLLLKGRHEVFSGLISTNSGVVLRDQGMGEDGTVPVPLASTAAY